MKVPKMLEFSEFNGWNIQTHAKELGFTSGINSLLKEIGSSAYVPKDKLKECYNLYVTWYTVKYSKLGKELE